MKTEDFVRFSFCVRGKMTMFARSWEISGREEKLMVRSEGREVG